MYVRLFNEKEITCEWNLNTRDTLAPSDKKKEEVKFFLNPSSGFITPG
jgi:hypothetical protein